MWDDGTYSKKINLNSGRAQGDGPSPLQYNFGEQILLLKIELDPGIRPAVSLAVEAGRILAPLPWFEKESNKSTGKVEALADDTTVIIRCCQESLLNLRNSLENFGKISGLECNFEKTCIIPIGGLQEIPFNIANTHFKVSDSVKLLGLDLDKNLNCLNTVHTKTLEKITNITRYWSRFYLSLPGRINIVKTLCLSQLSYLGCIISPSDSDIKKIEKCINNFVTGKMNISKDKLYKKPSEGGLGLINISHFLCAQQSLWIKKVLYAACDNWREDLFNITYGNPIILHPSLVDKDLHPILYNIACSFVAFKDSFFKQNDNYKKSPLLYNNIFTRNRNDRQVLNLMYFNQNPPLNPVNLAKLQFKDICTNQPYMLETINMETSMSFNLNSYLKIVGACTGYLQTLKGNRITDGTSVKVGDFFKTFKKGSGPVRRVLDIKFKTDIKQSKTVSSFGRISGLDLNNKNPKLQYSLWNLTGLKNDFREFIFKFYNNILGLNTRVSHFVLNITRTCTICSLKGINDNDETFSHFFLTCESVSGIRNSLYEEFFSSLGNDDLVKTEFWLSFPPPVITDRMLASIAALLIQFLLWKKKLKKKFLHLAT
jgi:hypothetical protein